jgi:hypothetical protein
MKHQVIFVVGLLSGIVLAYMFQSLTVKELASATSSLHQGDAGGKTWYQSNRLMVPLQVAEWPLEENFKHLSPPPKEYWLEIGANNRDLLVDAPEMKAAFKRGAVLLTFEPLLDKWASNLQKEGMVDVRVRLGSHHERGLCLPIAVGCRKESVTFKVSNIDGCSSILNPRSLEDLRKDEHGKESVSRWQENIYHCIQTQEERMVPCVSLEEVIGGWLKGASITHMKIDAQGFDLEVVRSAGRFVSNIKSVVMEAICDTRAHLYEGAPNCSAIWTAMEKMGFEIEDGRLTKAYCGGNCSERDLHFIRR